jgi:hypothetical protein
MLGHISLRLRLALVTAAALACPHPVSFREGGYLPVAVLLTALDDLDIALMFALLFGVYFFALLAFSYLLFGGRRPSP